MRLSTTRRAVTLAAAATLAAVGGLTVAAQPAEAATVHCLAVKYAQRQINSDFHAGLGVDGQFGPNTRKHFRWAFFWKNGNTVIDIDPCSYH